VDAQMIDQEVRRLESWLAVAYAQHARILKRIERLEERRSQLLREKDSLP